MPKRTNSCGGGASVHPRFPELETYVTSRDHLDAELALFVRRLERELQLVAARRTDIAGESFQGLAVSEAEAHQLLRCSRRARVRTAPGADAPSETACGADELSSEESRIQRRCEASRGGGAYLALAELASRFGLDRVDVRCVVAALAGELELRYEKLFGFLHDDVTRRRLSVELAVRLSAEGPDERERLLRELAGGSRLLTEHLLSLHDNPAESPTPLIARSLKLDDRIVRYLLDDPAPDERLTEVVGVWDGDDGSAFREWWPAGLREWSQRFAPRGAGREAEAGTIAYLYGPPGAGMREAAAWVARELGRSVLVVDVERARQSAGLWSDTLWRARREAKLTGALVCFDSFDTLLGGEGEGRRQGRELLRAAALFPAPLLLLGGRDWRSSEVERPLMAVSWAFASPTEPIRRRLWEEQLNGDLDAGLRAGLPGLAATFRVTPGQIRKASALARQAAQRRVSPAQGLTLADLAQACSAQTNDRLEGLARRLEGERGWGDLVLPASSLQQLQAIGAHVRFRDTVYGRWGFGARVKRSRGLNVLFYGGSGTGKTLAAEVLACALGLALYRIDLSSVVSKYIGETEKNLERIFAEAQAANAILLFDEADALFGKRSEVKDAHDRYANIEIGYLLQRMEDFDGVSILTTNLRRNLDDAFVRRLHFIVEFPFPDEASRLRIWRSHLPAAAPRAPDLDLPFLARQFKLSGGHIRNVVVSAAFAAAAAGEAIGMPHFIRGVYGEFQKIGRTCQPTEFGPFAAALEAPAGAGPAAVTEEALR